MSRGSILQPYSAAIRRFFMNDSNSFDSLQLPRFEDCDVDQLFQRVSTDGVILTDDDLLKFLMFDVRFFRGAFLCFFLNSS